MHEPFGLLPAFTQLQIFEVDHLPLPWYEPNVNLPLLCTLQRLQVKASSVQWMAGREFACLEECAVLLPHSWVAVQQHGVHLPSCKKLTYQGYPMGVIQHFHIPQMKAIELRSHDCKEQRVYQQLHHLCRSNGSISKLTILHLKLQCSEQAFFGVLKYFGLLEELVLSIALPSLSWQNSLELLAAKPSTKYCPQWDRMPGFGWDTWHHWCCSQTWHANVLPYLKYLGIQCPKGFSPSECLGNAPLFRLIAWTRAQSSPPLEHLKVWEGRGTTEDNVVDYISSVYLERYLGTSSKRYDVVIVKGMVTRSLVIHYSNGLLLFHQRHLTALFRQLQALTIHEESDIGIWILPDLEQIKRLEIRHGIIPAYSLNLDLPLVNTLQWLYLGHSTFFWMLGRTFRALEECTLCCLKQRLEDMPGHNELQVGIPDCTSLKWTGTYEAHCPFFFCPNVQSLQWEAFRPDYLFFEVALKSLHDVLLNSSCLQDLQIIISHCLGLASLIQLIFCVSLEQGVWPNIKSVEVKVVCDSSETTEQFFNQTVGYKQHYGELWKVFTVDRTYEGVYLR